MAVSVHCSVNGHHTVHSPFQRVLFRHSSKCEWNTRKTSTTHVSSWPCSPPLLLLSSLLKLLLLRGSHFSRGAWQSRAQWPVSPHFKQPPDCGGRCDCGAAALIFWIWSKAKSKWRAFAADVWIVLNMCDITPPLQRSQVARNHDEKLLQFLNFFQTKTHKHSLSVLQQTCFTLWNINVLN